MCGQRCWKSAHIGRIPPLEGPRHPQGAPPEWCTAHSLAVAAAHRGVMPCCCVAPPVCAEPPVPAGGACRAVTCTDGLVATVSGG